ncbi:MAG TPA: hypothetical protein PK256_19395 [Verrucomicrobiota bacterium]|nr:hypothetical protein [Verrucomicrobiota bacterium]
MPIPPQPSFFNLYMISRSSEVTPQALINGTSLKVLLDSDIKRIESRPSTQRHNCPHNPKLLPDQPL